MYYSTSRNEARKIWRISSYLAYLGNFAACLFLLLLLNVLLRRAEAGIQVEEIVRFSG